jgi:hypothetical protein
MPKIRLPGVTTRSRAKLETAERRTAKDLAKEATPSARAGKAFLSAPTADSFQNFALNIGLGTNNSMSQSSYGFNPITRNRTLLEWIHRGSWLGGVAIDLVADDMTRAGIDIQSSAKPGLLKQLTQRATALDIWGSLNEGVKWGRLYGGAVAMFMIEGQDPSTPLKLERIAKGQFRGLLIFDRWQLNPLLDSGNLVSEMGPHFGMPKFYQTENLAGVPRMKIHYSRIIRFGGIKLPYNQRMMENLWDESVLERLNDRMIAFDQTTQGAAQMATRASLRTVKINQLRQIIATGGKAYTGLMSSINFMSMFQGIEGITLLDKEDEFEAGSGATDLSGMAALLDQLGQQIAGALQIPIMRLFGQSPGGLSTAGDGEMRTYYDGIKQQQELIMREGIGKIYRLLALSEGIDLKDDFNFEFRSLWQMSDQQQADVAAADTTSILAAQERGVISEKIALQELQQRGKSANRWSNITDEFINKANDEVEPPVDTEALLKGGPAGKKADNVTPFKKKTAKGGDAAYTGFALSHDQRMTWRTKDSAAMKLPMLDFQGLPIIIEHHEGERRFNKQVMPASYGFIQRTGSAEGADQGMDVFIGPNHEAENIWIIDQFDGRTGEYDEAKVMLGFDNYDDACSAWDETYLGSPMKRSPSENMVDMAFLRDWLENGNLRQPVGPPLS